jgi:hypothetical protein
MDGRTDGQTDGRTDGRTDEQGDSYIPPKLCLRRYTNADSNSSLQQQQRQQILYLLRHNSVQEFIA